MKGKVYIGTSGWSYKHWKDGFYPQKLQQADWFRYYAERFQTVEINSSFYRLPTPKAVAHWAAEAPEGFQFCPKMSRYLTQYKKLRNPEEPLERFFEIFHPLQHQMGSVLIQLPPLLSFHYDVAEAFFHLLATTYRSYTFVLEIRHLSWLEVDPLALMTRYNIGFVISQSNGKFPYAEIVTAETVYLRFHGPTALYASPYSEAILQAYAGKIRSWKEEGHTIRAFFNNDIQGYATQDAIRLMVLCEDL